MALSRLQERVAALVAALPESTGFVLAGGAAMAAHGVLNRATRDLDCFAGPDDAAAVQRLADALEHAGTTQELTIQRQRSTATFVRFRVSDQQDECEIDLAIDYRALDRSPPVTGQPLTCANSAPTRFWPYLHAPKHATSSI